MGAGEHRPDLTMIPHEDLSDNKHKCTNTMPLAKKTIIQRKTATIRQLINSVIYFSLLFYPSLDLTQIPTMDD